jgi:hypothetical protein
VERRRQRPWGEDSRRRVGRRGCRRGGGGIAHRRNWRWRRHKGRKSRSRRRRILHGRRSTRREHRHGHSCRIDGHEGQRRRSRGRIGVHGTPRKSAEWLNPLGVAYHIYIMSMLQWYNTRTHIQKLYSLTLLEHVCDVMCDRLNC